MPEHPSASGLRRRRAVADQAAAHVVEQEIRDPRGGTYPLRDLLERRTEVHQQIDEDQRGGSRRHDAISPAQRMLARLLPVLDGLVLFWFLTGVLNSDLRRVDVLLVVAAVLAVLASVAVAAWNVQVGRHLQGFTDPQRRVVWGGLDVTAVTMVVGTAVMWLLLAAMMVLRVREEVFQATGVRDTTGWVIALTLACALVLVNAYTLHLALSDGSRLTRELAALGRALRGPLRRRRRLHHRAEVSEHRLRAHAEAMDRIHGTAIRDTHHSEQQRSGVRGPQDAPQLSAAVPDPAGRERPA